MLSTKLLRRAVLLAIVWAIYFYTLLLSDIWHSDQSVLISNAVDEELPLLISSPARMLLKSRITSGDVLIPQLFLNTVNGVDLSDPARQRLFRLAQSFIRAGLIKILGGILNVSTGGIGSLFVSGLLGTTGAASGRVGGVPTAALPVAAPQTLRVQVTGQFVQRGPDLVATINETVALGGA